MKALNIAETIQWLERHRIKYLPGNAGADGYVFPPETGHSMRFAIPGSANRQVLLAQGLAKLLPTGELLLWITYGDGADEEIEFFSAWRKDHGEERYLPQTPSYLFDLSSEHDQWKLTEAILILTALNWQGFVVMSDGQVVWLADEIIDLVVKDAGLFARLTRLLDLLGIESLEG